MCKKNKKSLTLPHSSSKVQSAMEPQVFCRVMSLPITVSDRGPVTMETHTQQYNRSSHYTVLTVTFTDKLLY